MPSKPSRRTFLNASLAAFGTAVTAGALTVPRWGGTSGPALKARTAAAVTPQFQVPMPIPPVLRPTSTAGGTDTYRLAMRKERKEILPGVQTEVLTYGGSFPGPTIMATSGRKVAITHTNNLDTPVSVHLHGASVLQSSDGDPMDTIAPGASRTYTYPNKQTHAALWYHDHAHHMESENVYRGLSGFYLLRDQTELTLPLPSGQYDIPIMLRDARIDDTGTLVYEMHDFMNRTTILANGKPWPYLQVAARKYRFRILNSTNLRFFTLHLSDNTDITQIGTDGGLLEKPLTTQTIALTPGERADIIIDFSRYKPGTQITLDNTEGPGPTELVGKILRFDITHTTPDPSTIPTTLRTLPPLPKPTNQRHIVLRMDEDGRPNPAAYIDDKTFDPKRIDQTITHGTTETWTVTNANQNAPHNFHMHLIQFRILERDGKPTPPTENGLKDTVRLLPGETVTLQATFNTYKGRYPYHCHLLDHSAMGMMAQMQIT